MSGDETVERAQKFEPREKVDGILASSRRECLAVRLHNCFPFELAGPLAHSANFPRNLDDTIDFVANACGSFSKLGGESIK